MPSPIAANVEHERRVFGPPGCGKTTELQHQIAHLVSTGTTNVLVASLTTSAASNIASRVDSIPRANIATLHAFCYRALNRPTIAEDPKHLKAWSEEHPQYSMSVVKAAANPDDGLTSGSYEAQGEYIQGLTGDELLARYNVLRARMLPEDAWPEQVKVFAKVWKDWKLDNDLRDFTDLIDICRRDVSAAPGDPVIGYFDETQDFTQNQLDLVRKWAKHMEYTVLAGDDDQASLPGTLVRLYDGTTKPVEELHAGERLLCYDLREGVLVGKHDGFALEDKQETRWNGTVVQLTAGEKSTTVTENHPCLVRWTEAAKHPDVHVVYLMRQGLRWRIGWCRLMRADGCLHLGVRAHLEAAEDAWILKVVTTRAEAARWESYFAVQYGLPTGCFTPVNSDRGYADSQRDRAVALLTYCNLRLDKPLYQRDRLSRGGARTFQTAACNVLSEYMAFPVVVGNDVEWMPVATTLSHYEGPVYGLSVEKHHTYVADGIVTHNCIYRFVGASPDAFLDPPIPAAQKRILAQSYRVPAAVHGFATQWVKQLTRREPKDYLPRAATEAHPDAEGELRRLPATSNWKNVEPVLMDAQKYLDAGKSVMFLSTCSFMLEPVKTLFRQAGIPFHNPYRRRRGDWNPLHVSHGVSMAQRLLAYLRGEREVWGEQAGLWTGDDLHLWASLLTAKGTLKHGAKQMLDQLEGLDEPFDPMLYGELFEDGIGWDMIMEPATLDWYEQRLLPSAAQRMAYPLEVARKRGAATLLRRPQVILGTVHSVKGGEADVVYLFPDLSSTGMQEWYTSGEPRDSIIRLVYVGLTRCIETLVMCAPATPFATNIYAWAGGN